MKQKLLWIIAALIVALPVATANAAPRGHFGGGGHVVVRGFFGPAWGWGWPYYGGYYYGGYGNPGYAVASNWAAVKTDVDPEEARVYLDGKYIGIADDFDGWPDKLYLRPGHYKLEFRLQGYEPLVLDVHAKAGTSLEVDNKLVKGGPRAVTAPDPPKMKGDVARFFGKRRDGDTARSYAPYRDRDGDRSSRDGDRSSVGAQGAQPDDGDNPEADADADRDAARDRAPARSDDGWRGGSASSDSATARSTRAPRARSRLTIQAQPADAAVYVDDRFVGTADELSSMDRGIVVSPGKHTVTVSRPGYRDKSSEVDVGAGKSESVKVSLER
jgi:PEGA domain